MEFPTLDQAKEKIIHALAKNENLSPPDIQVVASPYRICPLGAHVDHQGGPVLGMTIKAYTLIAFVPTKSQTIKLESKNYPGITTFQLDQTPESTESHWGQYVRSAVLALKDQFPIEKGIIGLVDGMLPGCGLSSSASVLLAYLYALTKANRIKIGPWDYVRLTRLAENKYMGLNNGILDQTSIVFGQKDHLLYIDTKKESVTLLPAKSSWSDYRILVAYSGYSRELTTSGFNTRVQECRQAAESLAHLADAGPAQRLSDIPEEIFARFGHRLPPLLGRRAKHYFGEVNRVHGGADAWKNGRIDVMGQLMYGTYKSLVELYECGIPALYDLQEIVSTTPGIVGSRFMGGGYGGCVVGFVEKDFALKAAETVQKAYRNRHPEVADQAAVYLTQSADGIHFL